MNKHDNVLRLVVYFIFMAAIVVFGNLLAHSTKDYEVITPETGVNCIVVSRMFNTSVDCWKKE